MRFRFIFMLNSWVPIFIFMVIHEAVYEIHMSCMSHELPWAVWIVMRGPFRGLGTERARLGTLNQNFEIFTQNEHLPAQRFFFLKFWTKIQKSSQLWGFWKKKSRLPTSPNFQTHKKIFLHTFTPIRFLFKICLKTYKSFIKIKGPKTLHFTFTFTFSLFTSLSIDLGESYRIRYRRERPKRRLRVACEQNMQG